MKKRESTATLRPLLRRYGLDAPLDAEIRQRISDDYRRVYDTISKRTSRMTVFAAIAAWMFFFVKKIGVPVPVAKTAAAAMLAVTIGAGAYVALHRPAPAPSAPAVRQMVTIRPFVSRSLGRNAGADCARALARALDEAYGRGFSRITLSPELGEARWAVFGTVEKTGGPTVMIVKVTDARTSRTVFMAEEKCDASGDCRQAAARIARKIPGLRGR